VTWSAACVVTTAFITHLTGAAARGPIPLAAFATATAIAKAFPTAYATSQADAIETARADFEAGRYAQAARVLEPVATLDTRDATPFFWLGRARLEGHDYRGAVEAFTRAVNLSPDNAEYRRWLARAHAEIADREHSFTMARRVRQELEVAVRLDPSNVAVRRDLMGFYLEAPWLLGGGEGKARAQVDAIAALDPIAGHLARAALFRHKNDGPRARAEYDAVLQAAPPTISPYLEAAEFYERADDAAGLQRTIEAAQRIDPGEPQLMYFRGAQSVLTRTGLDKAEHELLGYLDRVPPRSDRPSSAAAHEWLGRLYEALNRPDQAVAEYRKALELQSDRNSARDRLSRLQQRRN
jgi:tetratricopeptide (TPR) repeat protein